MRKKAIELLARREHSRLELKQKLTSREFDSGEIEILLDELEKQDLLSEERFVEMFVRSRKNNGFGPKKIIAELQTRGISNNLISSAVDEKSDEWRDNMIAAAKKKNVNREQLFRFLLYRGYSPTLIYQWLKT